MSPGPAKRNDRTAKSAVEQGVYDLLISGSLEMTSGHDIDARDLAAQLPAGMPVYVHHSPCHRLAQSHAALKGIRAAGLEPVPHIAARRIAARAELDSFLERAAGDCGVSKVLLIGGDVPQPLGPYASGTDVLDEGLFGAHGIREVGLPGYPEGHPRIPGAVLEQALSSKLALVAAQGLRAYIVTQFSFAPARVVKYCGELARSFPAIPVYVGLAGPTEARTLLRFAQRCGVSASLRALQAQGMGAIRLVTHTDPRKQLAAVARHCLGHESSNVVGAHFFSFGGTVRTVAWMNREITSGGDLDARVQ